MKKDLEIVASPASQSNLCYFAVSIPLLPGGKATCKSKEEAQGSELFTKIFQLDWPSEVAVEENKLVVRKMVAGPWQAPAKEIGQIIRTLHHEGKDFFSSEFISNAKVNEETDKKSCGHNHHLHINQKNVESELGKAINKIMHDQVAPALAAHGGSVTLVDVQDGKVFLSFSGGCQGCSQASVTVKDGIEKLLLKQFPEIKQVVDITNHTEGHNPYYR